jgi:hypothetical protein
MAAVVEIRSGRLEEVIGMDFLNTLILAAFIFLVFFVVDFSFDVEVHVALRLPSSLVGSLL